MLQQALQQQTDFAPALGSFGALQLSRHNLAGAEYYLDKAIKLLPKDPQILLWRAALYRRQGQYDAATHLMATATELAPLSGLMKRHYAYSLIGKGERGNVTRGHIAVFDQIGDLAGDHAGFAAACPGQYQAGAIDIKHGFFLAGIELRHCGGPEQMGEQINNLTLFVKSNFFLS